MNTKSSLEIYRNYKLEIKEERFYNNGEASRLLFRARSNTMALNDRFRHDRGGNRRNTGCTLCGADYENFEHFIFTMRRIQLSHLHVCVQMTSLSVLHICIISVMSRIGDSEMAKP